MKVKFALTAALLLAGVSGVSLACEYVKGETLFADWANCRYGEDSVVVVDLKENQSWDQCVYQVQAFRPAKLLAVTRKEESGEVVSINDRSKIGNPCYMTKSRCDAALELAGF